VSLELGRRVTELDLAGRRVRVDDGRSLTYDRLLLATGSRVRRLDVPGTELDGVHYLRTIADVENIVAALVRGARVLLVGAGYIGLEVAAVIRTRGFEVTVLEAADRVMARTAGPEVSAFYDTCHRAAGIDLHYGAVIAALRGTAKVSTVETVDGRSFACDLVIIGIGVQPNVELAAAAGLPCDNGIVVDEYLRTADPHVVAVGDCTNHYHPLLDRRIRLESVPNAVHHGKVAAATLLGAPVAVAEVPWFWSDQYDLKLQIVGLSAGYDEAVVRGDPASRSFAVFYLTGGRVLAVDAINSPRDFAAAKKLVSGGTAVPAATLRDATRDLATLA
jgi:3-phenylpropionate/trans-cinnamate dioxygenase ferredoxin reductase component